MDRICLPCSGQIMVEACYVDAWNTPLTDACVKVEDSTGVVVDGAIRTEPLAAHGQKDGDAPTAPLATMGTTPEIEVAHGLVDVSLVAQGAGEADSGMGELGAALTAFRDNALTKLQPYVTEWEAKGLLSIPEARLRGVGKGLSSWYEGEASFWGGVSEKAISAYQSAKGLAEDAGEAFDAYVARQTPMEQSIIKWGGPLGAAYVFGTSLGETAFEAVSGLIDGIDDLTDYFHIIMAVAMNMVPRFATFIAKLRGLAVKAKSLGVLADILDAFRTAITALAKIGKGLHDEIEAMTRAGADGVARIRQRLNQYKVEIDPNTLGVNGRNVRIVRKPKISRQTAPNPDSLDDARVQNFSKNHEQGGKTDMAEGIGSARYEAASGRPLTQSTTEGADIFDGTTGVQLKGPLVNKKTGELLNINDNMVDGLANSVVHDATLNSASSRLVVDTLGMTSSQRDRLISGIQRGLAGQPHLNKDIIILE